MGVLVLSLIGDVSVLLFACSLFSPWSLSSVVLGTSFVSPVKSTTGCWLTICGEGEWAGGEGGVSLNGLFKGNALLNEFFSFLYC